ncbi:2-dehydro-3-deoxy-D-gluconate 5-dehydrogenase KduD [Microvirga terricola]|uniref:2-dehydro-3-deoxy-D-gluconate 5-dehydrogenase KduD n=1 Tax=Microvirga terricola TaxID=2719797 RepID=A0ABX0VFQ8_9HYPH|nr:2-dehydro-3-deoxy-D-gluconate 5-dehydrogenase KduD [Microvirga terricola]NIX78363.1 2-dehydro-3-deoxy-D-gluconate 5-dehydrogenase KduD [Microvirga terricola]
MSYAFDLGRKVAIVTGANTGIGQGIALALAQAGASVVAVGRSSMDETRELIAPTKVPFRAVAADLSSLEPIEKILDAAEDLGRVDILVNNAGIIRRADAIDFTEQDWDDVMSLNLKTTFFFCQAAARRMLKDGQGGKIINIASLLSFQGGIRVPSYTASKSGVAGLTKLLANEWAAKGINVNAIAPGYIVTNNTEALRQDEKRSAEILSRIPAGRWGRAEDIGGAAVFLSSQAANYIHGTVLPVDGGWLAR